MHPPLCLQRASNTYPRRESLAAPSPLFLESLSLSIFMGLKFPGQRHVDARGYFCFKGEADLVSYFASGRKYQVGSQAFYPFDYLFKLSESID